MRSSSICFASHCVLGLLFSVAVASAQGVGPTTRQAQLIGAARSDGMTVRWDPARGAVSSIRGADLSARGRFSSGRGPQLARNATIEQRAIAVLDNVSGILRASSASREFRARRVQADPLGHRHVRVEQRHNGLRVVGAELIVHFDEADHAYEVNGRYIPGLATSASPHITAADAVAFAQSDLARRGAPSGAVSDEPELVIFARRAPARAAYQLTLVYGAGTAEPGRWVYWVDAKTGRVLERVSRIYHIPRPTTNGVHVVLSGTTLNGEGAAVTNLVGWKENTNSKYYLYNTNRQWAVKNAAASGWPDASSYAYRDTNDWGASDPTEISAALAVDATHRYFRDVHGLPGYDGFNTLARVNVHQGTGYVNAYWDGDQLYFGDGDGVTANSLAVQDVVGHEFTHAVTEFSANLIYFGEPGALNESFSDIFGASIEFFAQADDRASYPDPTPGRADWLMGEDAWLESAALRDLRDPANPETVGAGNEQPTRYKGSFWASGEEDSGGVHQNSGVQNFFYYLLCEGGSGTNDGLAYDLPGIGRTNAEQIAYRALTLYGTEDTDYRDVRLAWQSAAADLHGEWAPIVAATWDAVGVSAVVLDPEVDVTFVGAQGGPFHPALFVYTIYNDDVTNRAWSVANSEAWLDVAPSSGVVDAMGSSVITVTVNSAAASLPVGVYSDTLDFTNSSIGVLAPRHVTLRVMPPTVYAFDLDSDPGWTATGEWAFGEPTGAGGGEHGHSDPESGATGSNVYGGSAEKPPTCGCALLVWRAAFG